MEDENHAAVLKALADETRLRIAHVLAATELQACVCELVDALELPQYQVSRHLQVLKSARVVASRRDGTWIYHSWSSDSPLLTRFVTEWPRGEPFEHDRARLHERLTLRDGGKCVVGFVDPQELSRMLERARPGSPR